MDGPIAVDGKLRSSERLPSELSAKRAPAGVLNSWRFEVMAIYLFKVQKILENMFCHSILLVSVRFATRCKKAVFFCMV